jgi:hypothetical protein
MPHCPSVSGTYHLPIAPRQHAGDGQRGDNRGALSCLAPSRTRCSQAKVVQEQHCCRQTTTTQLRMVTMNFIYRSHGYHRIFLPMVPFDVLLCNMLNFLLIRGLSERMCYLRQEALPKLDDQVVPHLCHLHVQAKRSMQPQVTNCFRR